jgi:DNA-binding response OmpR family regulator
MSTTVEGTDQQGPARVLIVEDEPMIAANLKSILEESGYAVSGFASKLETALEIIESGDLDAAILDANLGGVSASPAASALAARGLPFIVLSGYSREQLQGDFSGGLFIQKPYRMEELIDGLRRVLAAR